MIQPPFGNTVNAGVVARQARARIREALALFVGDKAARRAELEDRVQVPKAVRDEVREAARLREQAEAVAGRAAEKMTSAVRVLEGLGLSVRDAGELLGVSHQRVQQLREAKAG